jgi:hypothetical protein
MHLSETILAPAATGYMPHMIRNLHIAPSLAPSELFINFELPRLPTC